MVVFFLAKVFARGDTVVNRVETDRDRNQYRGYRQRIEKRAQKGGGYAEQER